MKKLLIAVLNMFVILALVSILVVVVWNFSFESAEVVSDECVNVNEVSSFAYSSCYDAYSKTIFMEASRAKDSYRVNSLSISFFDINNQNYKLTDVPSVDGAKAYKIDAEKNPLNLSIKLNIVKDFSSPICEAPRIIPVRYCPVYVDDKDVDAEISPLDNIKLEDFVNASNFSQSSDIFSSDLVDPDAVWESSCKSSWKCSEWEACVGDVQRRSCMDSNKCVISMNVPKTVRYCNNTCVEDWECEWSRCNNGFSIPKCTDLNNCRTSYNRPDKIGCRDANDKCSPDIECNEWSDCDLDYDFVSLISTDVVSLAGSMSRVCTDKKKCVAAQEEVKNCSLSVDVYIKTFKRCGESFVGIYDQSNDELIVRTSERSGDKFYLNVYLEDVGEESYCDYCFNGKMDGDEDGLDCGGSCQDCGVKYESVSIERDVNLFDWIKGIFS